MLRASRRLLRPGGTLAFFTIFPTPGLSSRDYRRALELGPRAVATRRRDHRELLSAAGFEDIVERDRTASFRRVTLDMIELELDHEAELRPAVGDEIYRQRIEQLRGSAEAIEAGLLRRALFLARRSR